MNKTKFTNNELIGIMGDYPKFKAYVKEQMEKGLWKGTVDWFFYKDDYDEELYELNKELYDAVFDGEDEVKITINWSLEIN
jgi:hypothetical protein